MSISKRESKLYEKQQYVVKYASFFPLNIQSKVMDNMDSDATICW